jgi:short-subunit dehydrogenase
MNIILTGASRGIGYEIALALSKRNIDNLVVIARDGENLKKLKAKIYEINPQIKVIDIPVSLERIIEDESVLLDKIEFNTLDILINNAGYLLNRPFKQTSSGEAEKMLNVNFLWPAGLVRICCNLLDKLPHSHIVNIGSMGGFQGSSKYTGLSYYSASKAALACLTECLSEELKSTGIKANCLALGAVNTEMLNEAFPNYKAPLDAKEMGEFIADFALNGSKYFNGKIIPVSLSTP